MSSVYGHSEYKVFGSVSAFEITYRKRIRIRTCQILRNAQRKRIRTSQFFYSTNTDTLQIPCLQTRTQTRVRVRAEPYQVIPAENLVAAFTNSTTELMAATHLYDAACTMLCALEVRPTYYAPVMFLSYLYYYVWY
jgi:hypothetical protein